MNEYLKKTNDVIENGRLLLNIGPKSDGAIAEADASHKPNFHGMIRSVEVLGYDESPQWKRDENGPTIENVTVESGMPVVFKIGVE